MAKPPLVVGHFTFPSKKALELRCREILHKHHPERTIPEADTTFLRALLEKHRQSAQKIGCGVERFFVRINPHWSGKPNKGFWLQRTDGTETDFSYIACITPPSQRTEVMKGFRTVIHPDVRDFKQRAFKSACRVPCAATGALVDFENAHVDHKPPRTFVTIVDNFLNARGLTVDDLEVAPTVDGNVCTWLVDKELCASFRDFHRKEAELRILSARANLKRAH